jgi:hypothetical protein
MTIVASAPIGCSPSLGRGREMVRVFVGEEAWSRLLALPRLIAIYGRGR